MVINHYGEEPSYVQLAGLLRDGIASGEYPGDSLLPSIRVLADEHRLAAGTVRHAISVLVDEGLVRPVPGRGIYVLPESPQVLRRRFRRDRAGLSPPDPAAAAEKDDERPPPPLRQRDGRRFF
jgi:DNA-binding GntR family transcriptional regulator